LNDNDYVQSLILTFLKGQKYNIMTYTEKDENYFKKH